MTHLTPVELLMRYRSKRAAHAKGAHRDVDAAFRQDPACGEEYLRSYPDEPASAAVYAYRGQARLFRGRREEGLGDLERAAALEPAGWILAWLGEAYRQLGRTQDARRSFDEALRLDPRYANAWGWRGTLRLAAGDAGGALADLERAVKLQPTARGHMDRSRALRILGLTEKSLDALASAVLLNPELAWGGGDPASLERSLVEIRGLSATHPKEGRLDAWEGETLLRLGRPEEALQVLDRARRKAPRFIWARVWRAQALAETGRVKKAWDELAEARRKAPGYARAHLLAGALLLREGKPERALAPLSRAVRCAPYSARLYLARAGAYLRLGKQSAAKRDLDRALRLCPGFPDAERLRRAVDLDSGQKLQFSDVAVPVSL